MRRLLLTGGAGAIATAVRPVLRELAEEVVLTDRVAPAEPRAGERFIAADLADAAPWDGLAAGCDAVLHLGAVPDEAAFDVLAGPNLHGAIHVYEAARRAGARRVVVASSGRATGFYGVGERLATPAGVSGAGERQRRAMRGRVPGAQRDERVAGQRRAPPLPAAAARVDGDYRRQRRSPARAGALTGVDRDPPPATGPASSMLAVHPRSLMSRAPAAAGTLARRRRARSRRRGGDKRRQRPRR